MPGPASPPAPVIDRRALSDIAYGFMASKALFAALGVDLFTHLSTGPRTPVELSAATAVPVNRLTTLVNALGGLGLLITDGETWANAPACQRYLVRGAPSDFGDYFRLQVARQIYPALIHLDDGLAGTGRAFDTLNDLMADPVQARVFIEAQHAGSLATARSLAQQVDLCDARRLLDVGAGSGVFTIALCEANPGLSGTVLDFPAVVDLAGEYRDRAGLSERITLIGADAVHSEWPQRQDVVLLSYLLSALGADEIDVVLTKAVTCLRPGGLLIVHDFMLDDDRPGPALAALWFLQYLAYRGDGVSFRAEDLADRLHALGVSVLSTSVLIPQITKLIVSRRQAPT